MVTSLILIIFLSSFAASISFSEVELNPAGTDTGNEWVELYSDSEYDLTNHFLQNHDGKNFNLSGSFTGYYVITFIGQFLDNSNESLKLLRNSEVISQTSVLKDDKNNDLTWSFCNPEWVFVSPTKSAANVCTSSSQSISPVSSQTSPAKTQTSSTKTLVSENKSLNQENFRQINFSQTLTPLQNEPEPSKIILSPKSKSAATSNFTIKGYSSIIIPYVFSFICMIIIILLALRKL